MESKIELINISDDVMLVFLYVPKGYKQTKFTLTRYETKCIGHLNSFNRIKILSHLKKENKCLVSEFRKVLMSRGWDFAIYPNPTCTIAVSLDRIEKKK